MVQNEPAKKKVIRVQSCDFGILAGKSVQGLFVDLKKHEGVGMKARRWLQSNRNTKIGRIGCSQVFANVNITDYKGNYR